MKKVLLCIMDGVGYHNQDYGNAFKLANTKVLDHLLTTYPNSRLTASGKKVGLPEGQIGNSEVGHLNIGAGRIVYQSLERINTDIENQSFDTNPEFNAVIEHTINNNSKLHIMGLASDGGVHSSLDHLLYIIKILKARNIPNVYLHLFTDGRDTAIDSGQKYLETIETAIKNTNIKIASICGRFYAMDRDNRYERVEQAYNLITKGIGTSYKTALEAWQANHNHGITDEFITPSIIDPQGLVSNSDGILVFNFRPDRIRELFSALSNPKFSGFKKEQIANLKVVTMMPVSSEVICTNMYDLITLKNTLGPYISNQGLRQLRIAETEKYAHVTFFFDGGEELQLNNCKRILIPSPKVETYDLKPEMSAYEITDTLIQEVKTQAYDLIVLNFANGDMVGHTGKLDKAIKAVECVDTCLGKLIENLQDYTFVITADHGNCEVMINEDNSVNTAHTTNVVPFIITDKNLSLKDGKLADIAPTILNLMGLNIPSEMDGDILITS